MKQSNRDEIVVHYIPEFYNDIIDKNTGKEYGWCQIIGYRKPYVSKSQAINQCKRWSHLDDTKKRIRIETFKCIDVKFEDVK